MTVESEYRLYPGIPRDKVCIINRELVLHGLYDVIARPIMRLSDPEYYSPQGSRTDLNVWSARDTDDTRAAVAAWNKHLDGLWSLATVPPWRRVTATCAGAFRLRCHRGGSSGEPELRSIMARLQPHPASAGDGHRGNDVACEGWAGAVADRTVAAWAGTGCRICSTGSVRTDRLHFSPPRVPPCSRC